GSSRKMGGVSANGTGSSPGLASALPASSQDCASEGVSPGLRRLMVTSRLAAGYTTRVPSTTTLAPAVPGLEASAMNAASAAAVDLDMVWSPSGSGGNDTGAAAGCRAGDAGE